MMERMQGKTPRVINPFNKGLYMNVTEFFLPLFSCFLKKGHIKVQTGPELMAPRKKKAIPTSQRISQKKQNSLSKQSEDSIEMTDMTIHDIDEEAKLDSERSRMLSDTGDSETLTPEQQLEKEAQKYGIDPRKFDLDYLLQNSPFKMYSRLELTDWSQMRIYSLLQIPEHPSYQIMYSEIKKFMPQMLANAIRQEKFRRGDVDPQYMHMMHNQMAFRTPGGQNVVVENHQHSHQHNHQQK